MDKIVILNKHEALVICYNRPPIRLSSSGDIKELIEHFLYDYTNIKPSGVKIEMSEDTCEINVA